MEKIELKNKNGDVLFTDNEPTNSVGDTINKLLKKRSEIFIGDLREIDLNKTFISDGLLFEGVHLNEKEVQEFEYLSTEENEKLIAKLKTPISYKPSEEILEGINAEGISGSREAINALYEKLGYGEYTEANHNAFLENIPQKLFTKFKAVKVKSLREKVENVLSTCKFIHQATYYLNKLRNKELGINEDMLCLQFACDVDNILKLHKTSDKAIEEITQLLVKEIESGSLKLNKAINNPFGL